MPVSISALNRLGFSILGLTNNFAYVIMLSAAYDLLKPTITETDTTITLNVNNNPTVAAQLANTTTANAQQTKYCNPHSTSTILLADTLPSLTTKIIYPFLLVSIPTYYKASASAILAAAAFIITGFSVTQALIFTGVVCASLSSGLGESTYLSNTPLYGDSSLSGWSIGTGAAGLLGAAVYALLRMILTIKTIMIIMLVVPVAMLVAYFYIIVPISETNDQQTTTRRSEADKKRRNIVNEKDNSIATTVGISGDAADTSAMQEEKQQYPFKAKTKDYGGTRDSDSATNDPNKMVSDRSLEGQLISNTTIATGTSTESNQLPQFNLSAKLKALPSLAKYFLPLLLVYFAEYFINQGLFELVYYPEISFLDHAAQYRWFQVSYQLGVMISRSSLDFFRIKNIWTMSLLQAANAILFLAHASKLIHIPSFYLVIALIIYEGLLGGFTYVNAFYRVKKEVDPDKQEFCISTVTMADSLGIVLAGFTALPVHQALCKLYD